MENNEYPEIDSSMFEFVQADAILSDTKMKTKRIGYLKDAFMRFCRNKASIAAAVIIAILFLFAIIAPVAGRTNYTETSADNNLVYYEKLLPKISSKLPFWNGCSKSTINSTKYLQYLAYEQETGRKRITKVQKTLQKNKDTYYVVSIDSYANLGFVTLTLPTEDYEALQKYQDDNHIQIIYPAVDTSQITNVALKNDANVWFQTNKAGVPTTDASGNFVSIYKTSGNDDYTSVMRIASDDGTLKYARASGSSDWEVRIDLYEYFVYLYGYEPSFIFGTDGRGYDIFTRLGKGARVSFILSIGVATINLIIGAIWGSICGYYGGTADLVMERITDILSGIPFIVVTTLFQLHLASKVGSFGSLLFAFVTTGWIGTAGTVRMQFYRYKNQEYILAARTLGARDGRLMFKHIFPNALGTIITSSVLVIPGVIFEESSLSYLHIINLEGDGLTSVGTMLSFGKDYLSTYPHIILFPALFISLLMITFNLFGNGLRDAFNPSLRGTED